MACPVAGVGDASRDLASREKKKKKRRATSLYLHREGASFKGGDYAASAKRVGSLSHKRGAPCGKFSLAT